MVGGDLAPQWFVDSESVGRWPGPGYLTEEARDDVEAGLRAEEKEERLRRYGYIPAWVNVAQPRNTGQPDAGEETVTKMRELRI